MFRKSLSAAALAAYLAGAPAAESAISSTGSTVYIKVFGERWSNAEEVGGAYFRTLNMPEDYPYFFISAAYNSRTAYSLLSLVKLSLTTRRSIYVEYDTSRDIGYPAEVLTINMP